MSDHTRRRKVLMITFHYPPSNTSSGGLRPLKLGKYLRELGWDSSVLTVPPECHASTDPALLQQVPAGVAVHRAFCVDAKVAFSIRGKYPGFAVVPDRYLSWLPFGVRRAVRLLHEEGADAIYSTSPPPTAHLIALLAKRITKRPWVADFRDPWVETEGSEVHGRVRQAVELRLERSVVTRADRVLVTTPELGELLSTRYGRAVSGKIDVVYNGYDEEDFTELRPAAGDSERFTVVHAGLLHPYYRNPAPVLQAVRECLERRWLPATALFDFVGVGEAAARARLARMAQEMGVQAVVRATERVPYREALARLSAASVLLLLQGGDDTHMLIPAKAFEYLRTGRLIVALTPEASATARLAREFSGSFVAPPDDPMAIARQLAAAYETWSNGTRTVDRVAEGLARYSRRAAAGDLARVLVAMTG
jgi:glycosyltransferase involved in cell wall biosynthesis